MLGQGKSERDLACIKPAKTAHSHTHTFMSHKTIKITSKTIT